jgi:hypothetical protein
MLALYILPVAKFRHLTLSEIDPRLTCNLPVALSRRWCNLLRMPVRVTDDIATAHLRAGKASCHAPVIAMRDNLEEGWLAAPASPSPVPAADRPSPGRHVLNSVVLT